MDNSVCEMSHGISDVDGDASVETQDVVLLESPATEVGSLLMSAVALMKTSDKKESDRRVSRLSRLSCRNSEVVDVAQPDSARDA